MNFNFSSGNTPANTGSIFGQQTATNTFGTAGTGGLFGSTTPASGAGTSLFGNNPTSVANTSGFGFGNTTTAVNAFGAPNTSNAFGQNTVAANPFSTANTFNTASNTTASSGTLGNTSLGVNRFGAGFSSGLGSFGNTTGTTNVAGTSTLGAFGAPQQTQQNNAFGFNAGGFATGPTTLGTNTGNAFGGTTNLFGAKPANSGQFSFNTLGQNMSMQAKPTGLSAIGQPSAIQREVDPNTFLPKLFNDERDRILGEFNKLQAYWGTGKGFFAPNVAPVEFNQQQSTHKFKAIGFSEIKTPSVWMAFDWSELNEVLLIFFLHFGP